jgi:phosphoserine phosphatase RsbX
VEAKTLIGAILRPSSLIECGVAMTPIAGETESGDRCLVVPTDGSVLIAVIDGLGHGREAAKAAAVAAETLESCPSLSVTELLRRCHESMHATRGAAMSLASFSGQDRTLSWLGVGNVDGILLRRVPEDSVRDEKVLLRGGVVGLHLPPLRAAKLSVSAGDLLIFATDGIRPEFSSRVIRRDPPQRIADAICASHSKRNDDALVLVVRFTGMHR